MQNDLLLIRIGFTDYNKDKTKRKDIDFDNKFKYAVDNNIKFIIYYESRAISIREAKEEISFLKRIICNISNYPIGIKFEDDHNICIYYPNNHRSIKKKRFKKIVKYMYNKINSKNKFIITYNYWCNSFIKSDKYNVIIEDYEGNIIYSNVYKIVQK